MGLGAQDNTWGGIHSAAMLVSRQATKLCLQPVVAPGSSTTSQTYTSEASFFLFCRRLYVLSWEGVLGGRRQDAEA